MLKKITKDLLLKEVIDKTLKYQGNKRLEFLLIFYKKNTELINIKKHYLSANYITALGDLIKYIKKNGKYLLLDVVILNNNFVNKYLNDYPFPNYAVIKTYSQLMDILLKLKLQAKLNEAKLIKRLLLKTKKTGKTLLLVDKLEDSQKLLLEIFHELNTWLITGCANSKLYFKCYMTDWRKYIPRDNLHRKLNRYIANNKV